MKGLRTPWGDAGGGAWAGEEEGEGRVMVKRRGGSEIESWRGRKRPAGFYLFILFFSLKLTMLTHNMLQCCHGNVLCDVLLTFTHHIILCKMFWCASGVVFIAFATANWIKCTRVKCNFEWKVIPRVWTRENVWCLVDINVQSISNITFPVCNKHQR